MEEFIGIVLNVIPELLDLLLCWLEWREGKKKK